MTGSEAVRAIAIAAISMGVLAACGDQAGGGEETTTTQVAAETPPQPAAAPSADEVPVPEDFADRAEAEITRESYRDQLAAIESEIDEE